MSIAGQRQCRLRLLRQILRASLGFLSICPDVKAILVHDCLSRREVCSDTPTNHAPRVRLVRLEKERVQAGLELLGS